MLGGKQFVIWALVLMAVSVTGRRRNPFLDVVERLYEKFHDEFQEQEEQNEMQDPGAGRQCVKENLSYFLEENQLITARGGLPDEKCRKWCDETSECVSWTNMRGLSGGSRVCYLMSAYDHSEDNSNANSGIKNCGKNLDPSIWDKVSVGGSPGNEPLTIPMTEADAKGGKKSNWRLIADGCNGEGKFPGRRYDHKGNMENIAIYDGSGLIVGKQLAVPEDKFVLIKDGKYASAFVKDKVGDKTYYFLTAYFRPPSFLICAKTNDRPQGVAGNKNPLYIKTGPTKFINVPFYEEKAKKKGWVEGGCIPGRGRYFWYKISSDMRCQDFLPFYVIYDNGRRLNAWGFYLPGFKDGWSSQSGKKMDGLYWMQKHKKGSFKSLFKEKTYPTCSKDLPNYTKQIFMKEANAYALNYACFPEKDEKKEGWVEGGCITGSCPSW